MSDKMPTHEQIAEAIIAVRDRYPRDPRDVDSEEVAYAVLALFPQPTPSAEPVSIDDMAPGTTLWARFVDEDHDRFLVIVNEPEWPVLDPIAADQWQYSHVDTSTIRDATPPTTTPGSES